MADNALKRLLAAGDAGAAGFAGARIFGSDFANEEERQAEVVARGRLNGSGPVNARSSMEAPKSWTDYFFGTRATMNANGQPENSNSPMMLIVTAVIAGLVLWWLLKGRK